MTAQASSPILFFLCLNDRGGAESSMIAIAKGLMEEGRPVSLAVYGAQPWLARDFGFSGEVIDLRVRRTTRAILPLVHLLRRAPFPVLITALPYTNLAAFLAVKLARVSPRLFFTEHGVEGLLVCEKSRFFSILVRYCYARATGVVSVAQRLAKRWIDFLPPTAHVTTIFNPVVPDSLPAPLPPAHSWLVDKETPVIIAVGRLKAEKNFVLLVRAFARVAAKRKVHLVILGEGDQRPVLEQNAIELDIGEKVLLPGFKTDLAAWLPYAALFVSSSNREGFGNAIVEALAYGVPVVATDCPYGPAEILQDGNYGRLVPMDDVEALAQAINETLDKDEKKEKMRERAQYFSAKRCIDGYGTLVDNQASK